jgi:hypothetical protein
MAQTLAQIQCPQCKAPTQAALEQIIDVRNEPAAKARLLANSLNLVQCTTCGYEGQLAAPLIYHDQEKELLLIFIPSELGLKKDDQERTIGKMLNSLIDKLPAEERKGYLLQPVSMLTRQSMIERILEADGITREQIDAQRERMRLFEEMMSTPEDKLMQFVVEHDKEIDATFLQLANLSLQSTGDQRVQEFASQHLARALQFSTLGKEIKAQEEALRAAAESLQEAGSELTRERLLEIVIEARDEDRVAAIVSLARPGFDYAFFQLLSNRIDEAEGKEQERLNALRAQILKQTEELDEIQQERVAHASARLQALAGAEDLDQELQQTLPYIDDLFISVLQASLQAAQERDDKETIAKLQEIDNRLSDIIRASLPPGLLLVQKLLETQEPDKAREMLEASVENIDEEFLGGLTSAIQRVEAANEKEKVEELKELYRLALRLSMRSKLKASEEEPKQS